MQKRAMSATRQAIAVSIVLACFGAEIRAAEGFVQVGANHGLLALGAGDIPAGWARMALSLGVTPAYGERPVFSQLNVKLSAPADGIRLAWLGSSLRLGAALFVHESFRVGPVVHPSKNSDIYRPPNSLYIATQASLQRDGFFMELSMLGYYYHVLAGNPPGSWPLLESISLGAGYFL